VQFLDNSTFTSLHAPNSCRNFTENFAALCAPYDDVRMHIVQLVHLMLLANYQWPPHWKRPVGRGQFIERAHIST
jgi:hypothetical protein